MNRVAISGLGAHTGFGKGVDSLWAGLCAGENALRKDAGGWFSRCLDVTPHDTIDRASRLAQSAAEEAIASAKLVIDGPRVGLVVATTLGSIDAWLPQVRAAAAATPAAFDYAGPAHHLARALGITGPVEVISSACASSNVAIGVASDLITLGRCDAVIVGGVDALNDFVCEGFRSLRALSPEPSRPFDRLRQGLNLGEGGGFIVVESEAHANARGANVLALIAGCGVASDAVHMTAPDQNGNGAARAMRAALFVADLAAREIDHVNAHGTATLFNDAMESRAFGLVFGEHAATLPINSIKGAIGHTLGAAGALEAIVCVRSLQQSTIVPTCGLTEIDPAIPLAVTREKLERPLRNILSTSSGFGGINATVIFSHA